MDRKYAGMIGLLIVVGTHIPMLFDMMQMATLTDRRIHAIANLVASGLIVYGA